MKKRLFMLLSAMFISLFFSNQQVDARHVFSYYAFEGETFEELTDAWSFDENTGTLTIKDEAVMLACTAQYPEEWEAFSVGTPWAQYGKEIKNVVIYDGIKTIGESAFAYCINLQSITIPDSVTTIKKYAFYGCSSLKSITIPENVTTIEEMPFYKCASLEKITVSSKNKAYTSKSGILFNKDMTTLICYPRAKSGTSYKIPSTVKTIDQVAFYAQNNLTKVTISKNVVTIDAGAFQQCSKLKQVTFEKNSSVKYIKERYDYYNDGVSDHFVAFGFCTSLTSFSIPNKTIEVGPYTFKGCSALKSVSIGKSLKTIENSSRFINDTFFNFKGCDSLEKVTVSSANKYYKSVNSVVYSKDGKTLYLYPVAKKGTSLTISSSVKTVYDLAFRNNKYLKTITMGKNVTKIGNKSFYGCKKLTSIKLNSKLKKISNQAFRSCKKLKTITIPDKVTKIGEYAFDSCSALTKVIVGKSVEILNYCAFSYCDNLKSVSLNNGLKTIEDSVFFNCPKLKSLKVPKSVTTMKYCEVGEYFKKTSASSYTRTKVKGFVLYGYKGSEAQKLAKKNGFTFKAL